MSDLVALTFVLPLVFNVSGAVLLVLAARRYAQTRRFLADALPAWGKVVALEEVPPQQADESATYRPVVVFEADASQSIRFESLAHSNPPRFTVGQTVPVLYRRGQPHDARIRSFVDLWLLAIVLGLLGGALLGVGLALWLGWIPL